jgi:heat shock protein HslJ
MRRAAALLVLVLAGCAASSRTGPGGASTGPAGADAAPAATSPGVGITPESDAAGLFGRDWIFFEVEGYEGPLPSPPPIAGFNITREGRRVTGTTACNRIGAGYEIDEYSGRLRFTNLRNTRMLCDRVAADTEEAVLAAMIATDAYRLDRDRLVLLSKGRVIARLKTVDPVESP